jgi:hypothetical protein
MVVVFVGAFAVGGPELGVLDEPPPEDVSTAHPKKRMAPPTRHRTEAAVLGVQRGMAASSRLMVVS